MVRHMLHCSALQCVVVCCSLSQSIAVCATVCCRALQCVAVRCGALRCVAERCRAFAVRCSVLRCVAVRSSELEAPFTCATWLSHMCDMTHAHVWHGSFTCVPWLIPGADWDVSVKWKHHLHVRHDSVTCTTWLKCVTWLSHVSHVNEYQPCHTCEWVTWLSHMYDIIQMCDMNHSHVWRGWYLAQIELSVMNRSTIAHDPFICVTRLIHICDMTHSHLRHDSFICVTWRIHMRNLTYSYGSHDKILTGSVLSTMLLRGINRKSHWQNSSTSTKFQKLSHV